MLCLEYPRVMVRRVLVDVADNLITGLKRIPVGDHANRFRGVGGDRDVVGRGLHQLAKVTMKTLDNILLAGVLKQQPTPDGYVPIKKIGGTIGSRFVQMRNTTMCKEIYRLLDWEMVEVDRNGQIVYSVSLLNVEWER